MTRSYAALLLFAIGVYVPASAQGQVSPLQIEHDVTDSPAVSPRGESSPTNDPAFECATT